MHKLRLIIVLVNLFHISALSFSQTNNNWLVSCLLKNRYFKLNDQIWALVDTKH